MTEITSLTQEQNLFAAKEQYRNLLRRSSLLARFLLKIFINRETPDLKGARRLIEHVASGNEGSALIATWEIPKPQAFILDSQEYRLTRGKMLGMTGGLDIAVTTGSMTHPQVEAEVSLMVRGPDLTVYFAADYDSTLFKTTPSTSAAELASQLSDIEPFLYSTGS